MRQRTEKPHDRKTEARKAATFAEKVYSALLEQLDELEAQEKAGAPVQKEIAVLQLLLRQQRQILKRPPTLADFDQPGDQWGHA